MTSAAVLVLGVGNEWRGDDAIGLVVARRTRERAGDRVIVRETRPDAMLMLDAWVGADQAIVVDAMSSGLAPGTIRRFDALAPIPTGTFAPSTHALGASHAIEIGRALGRLPGRLVVVGIEGARFAPGAGLSPLVEAAVPLAVERVLAEIAR